MTEPSLPVIPRYPHIHCLLYGESGSGKSSFWATAIRYWAQVFNEPSLVMTFDPWDKATPYRELGAVQPNEDAYYKQLGIEVDDIVDDNKNVIVRIEYYAEPVPDDPKAYDIFESRMRGFEAQARSWASVAIDSMTFMQRASLLRWKKVNPLESTKQHSNLSWYGGMAEDATNTVMSRACWWKTNVCIICHIDENKDDLADFGAVRSVALAGKLSKRAPAGFGEVYRMRIVPSQKQNGEYLRELQTRGDTSWVANSLVAKAPNPCQPSYEALWANWKVK